MLSSCNERFVLSPAIVDAVFLFKGWYHPGYVSSHIECITHPRRRIGFCSVIFYFAVFPLVIDEFSVKIIDSIYFMKIASVCSFIFPVTLPTMDCCIRKVIA